MRNLQRHRVVVGRQESVSEADVTYYSVDMFVQAPRLNDTTIIQGATGGTSLYDWIKTYCATDFPKTQIINDTIRRDWVYWEGKWYRPLEQSNMVKMGNKTYFERYCFYSSSVDTSVLTTPPPTFDTEYYPFLDAVGQTTMAVEMAYLPLINKLENL